MMAPSTWPGSVKLGLALLGFAVVFLSYATLCAGLAQLAYIIR